MAIINGSNKADTLIGTLGDDILSGKNGNDVIYGDVGASSGQHVGAVFVMGADFSNSSGNFHTWGFPPTLNFTGTTTQATFKDDDGKLNGDDCRNEFSDDKTQTVDIAGQQSSVNIDYTLQYCDTSGNIYTFAIVDVDLDSNGHHYHNLSENGKILLQLDGPQISESATLSIVPNSYENISSLDYASFTQMGEADHSIGGDDTLYGGDGDDTVYGQGGKDYIEGNNGQDRLFGGDGDDVIYGNSATPNFNAEPGVNVFIMGESFSADSGNFHTWSFPRTLDFNGTKERVTFNDNDDTLDGDDCRNEFSKDTSQSVNIGENTYSANVDYSLKYCDTDGNIYTFVIVDVDLDGNGHHYYNLDENGKILIQTDGPEISSATQLSIVPHSYQNVSKLDYADIEQPSKTNVHNDEDYIDGGKGNDTLYGQWGDDVIYGGEGDDIIFGGKIAYQTQDLTRQEKGTWDISDGGVVTLDISNITTSAAYNNSIGYYVLDENGQVLKAALFADNVKNVTEAQVQIDQDDGMILGLFLIPDGDNKGFDVGEVLLDFSGASPTVSQGGASSGVYVSEAQKNGDNQDHEINTGTASCWEDLWGLGDRDFNDVVFNVKASQRTQTSDKDTIYGGEGDDTIYGGDDDDIIYGGEGNDVLHGNNGNDILHGGDGDDVLYGTSGNDILLGGNGNDFLHGGYGSDTLIDGQAGIDEYLGSAGNDVMIFGQDDFVGLTSTNFAGRVINKSMYNADNGFDTLIVNGDATVDFTGASYQLDASIRGNVIHQIEAVIGDEGDQDVTVNPYAILAHSDAPFGEELGMPDDWDGFVAYLGEGDDSFDLSGDLWSYDANAAVNAPLSAEMISVLGLNNAQVAELDAYVFTNDILGKSITLWTDAEDVTMNGFELF